jgi:ferredoxin
VNNKVLISYFSGTGGVKRIADCFESELKKRGFEPTKIAMEVTDKTIPDSELDNFIQSVDFLILLYAVHAFDAPDPVFAWIGKLDMHRNKIAVISVSAGGDKGPNRGSRIECCKALEEKGFNIIHEKMMIMPCNWVVTINDHAAMRLINAIPKKVISILGEIIAGRIVRSNVRKGILQSVLSRLEKFGATRFPKSIRIEPGCNGCGYCARHCPVQNIVMTEREPLFLEKCAMCFRCIYSCPKRAIKSTSFTVIKDGFDLAALEKRMKNVELRKIEECTKGFLWSGVKEYLEELEEA